MGLYYPCSENKGADQLRGYREADLRLCFRLCKLLVFSCTGSHSLICLIILIKFIQFLKVKVLKSYCRILRYGTARGLTVYMEQLVHIDRRSPVLKFK